MSWTAIVPIKPPGMGKTRLAGCLAAGQRARLIERMLDHVLAALADVPLLEVRLLCPSPPAGWAGHWTADEGRGLNAELEAAARAVPSRLLVIHADLPMLKPREVADLLQAAAGGIAIAPDRHRMGTNAIAVADPSALRFAFGPGSFVAHRRAARGAIIVDRPGLAHDLDTPEDLAALLDGGALGQTIRNALAA
jgi:2-phospho-L-lactate/phosphoenolpyruvate guanylyltransferase